VDGEAIDARALTAMSAAFSIEKPTVVATLPRPVDQSIGRYVVSEVHGGIPGSRKRKRSELAVGVDGEGLSIYDVRLQCFAQAMETLTNKMVRLSPQNSSLPTRFLHSRPSPVLHVQCV
jgi:hypothetical protein